MENDVVHMLHVVEVIFDRVLFAHDILQLVLNNGLGIGCLP